MGADLVLWLPLTKLGPSYDDSTVTQDILFSKVKKEGLGIRALSIRRAACTRNRIDVEIL